VSERYDVVIVGAGVIGLACAWRAARAGFSVCCLDRAEPGSGATSAAVGIVGPSAAGSIDLDILRLALASSASFPAFAEELAEASGLDPGFRQHGSLFVAIDEEDTEWLRREQDARYALGLPFEPLSAVDCRRLEPGLGPSVAVGMLTREDGAVDPSALVHALETGAERAGVVVRRDAEVVGAAVVAGRLAGVETAAGASFSADAVVLAAGWESGAVDWLPPEAVPPVRPVKGVTVVLRHAPDAPAPCARNLRAPLVHLAPRAGGRLAVGSTEEDVGPDTTVDVGSVHALLGEAFRVLPAVASLELSEARAGLRPTAADRLPLVGEGRMPGLIVATGHYRQGVMLAPVTSDAVVALLRGDEPDSLWEPFRPSRLH
jgi:glycine oxidase